MKNTGNLEMIKEVVNSLDPITLWMFKHSIDMRIEKGDGKDGT